MEIESKVILLAIYKDEENKSFNDILLDLCDTGMFDLKEAKARLKTLKKEQYIVEGRLSMKGLEKAKEVESEFKV